ncbi:SIMPL domain-containing protein [Thalassotalea psychrophila]|uniref:SIMPL domain-containing protein n=1 Tax=Thalassotalea psychrophila TaxID=3065647 RepID=A0ABY9TPT0_9GAMM|nr:SIMPL domain-containing protein [Colwelliaceae bacterium SQ149]
MIKNKFIAFTVLLLSIAGQAVNAEDINPPGVEVTGKGAVLIDPDIFTFSITLADRAMTAEQAKQVVDEKTNELLALAKKIGVDQNSIETTQMSIRPIFDNKSKSAQDLYQPSLIDVSRELTFILTNFEHYDPILDQAIRLGVKHISKLQYETSKADEYYRQALNVAIKDAEEKAKQIASRLNFKLGAVTHMSEFPHGAPRVLMTDYSEGAKSISFRSNPGKREISAQITLIYSINH